MPSLNNENAQGFLYGLFCRNRTARQAHAALLQYTGAEIVTLPEVKQLFVQFEKREFKMDPPKRLVLVKNSVFTKHAVQEFIHYWKNCSDDEKADLELVLDIPCLRKFHDAVREEQEKIRSGKSLYYSMDFYIGFLQYHKSRGIQFNYAYGIVRDHISKDGVLSLQDIAQIYRGLDMKGTDMCLPTEALAYMFGFLEISSRINLRQTSHFMKDMVEILKCHIDCININTSENFAQIVAHPMLPQHAFQWMGMGCFRITNDSVSFIDTSDRTSCFQEVKKQITKISKTPNLKIKNFKVVLKGILHFLEIMPPNISQLPVENLYVRAEAPDNFFLQAFVPGVLKKIILSIGKTETFNPFVMQSEQWRQAEVFVCDGYCDPGDGVYLFGADFKMARYRVFPYDIKMVWALQDCLLQHLDFRELKVRFTTMTLKNFNHLNKNLGTFNDERRTENPNWTRIPYPPPNQNKYLWMTAVGKYMWFRGPEYIIGEMEEAEQELKDMRRLNREAFRRNRMFNRAPGFKMENGDEEEAEEDDEDVDDEEEDLESEASEDEMIGNEQWQRIMRVIDFLEDSD